MAEWSRRTLCAGKVQSWFEIPPPGRNACANKNLMNMRLLTLSTLLLATITVAAESNPAAGLIITHARSGPSMRP